MKALSHVIIKIMAVFYFIRSLFYIESVVNTIIYVFAKPESGMESIINWSYIITPAFMVLISILLWIFADNISNAIVKGMDESVEARYDFDILLNLALIIVGIVLAVMAVSDLISAIYSITQYKNISDRIADKNVSDIIANALRLIIGVWFTFGFKGLGDMIKRLGRAGVYSLKDEHTGNDEK